MAAPSGIGEAIRPTTVGRISVADQFLQTLGFISQRPRTSPSNVARLDLRYDLCCDFNMCTDSGRNQKLGRDLFRAGAELAVHDGPIGPSWFNRQNRGFISTLFSPQIACRCHDTTRFQAAECGRTLPARRCQDTKHQQLELSMDVIWFGTPERCETSVRKVHTRVHPGVHSVRAFRLKRNVTSQGPAPPIPPAWPITFVRQLRTCFASGDARNHSALTPRTPRPGAP